MKITSIDGTGWVNLECKSDISGHSGVEVEVSVDIGHGRFDAKHIAVQFLNLNDFVSEFDRFILDRRRTPRLEGTYDTYIAFSTIGSAVMLEYRLGDAFCGRKTLHFYQSGEFEVQQEHLLQILAGFRELMLAKPSAAKDPSKKARP